MIFYLPLIFVGVVAGLASGFARRNGSSRIAAFCIPIVPLLIGFLLSLLTGGFALAGHGGLRWWGAFLLFLFVAIPVSAATVFFVGEKDGDSSN